MKIATTAAAAATLLLLPGTITAFAPATPAARPSAPFATTTSSSSSSSSSSLAAIDPSAASDAVSSSSSSPDLLIPAAGAAVAALGVAIATTLGKSKKDGDAAKDGAAPAVKEVEPEIIDVSIPYDAPASLAFQSLTKDAVVDYDQFKSLYEAKMVAEVKAKVQSNKIVEMEKVLKGMEDEVGDIQKEIDLLFIPAEVEAAAATTTSATAAASSTPDAAAQDVDLSIPYDAAAKLAYESSDKSMDYDAFKTKHEADAVELVVAKKVAREQQ